MAVPENFQLELIELKSNSYLRDEYEKNRRYLPDFYKLLEKNSFPEIRRLAQRTFTMFASTYLCEQTFSRLNGIKTSERSSLTDDHTHAMLRTATTKFTPEMSKLVSDIQSQPSH
jgi:17beta-estradiol 17-dehydrogenase/3beta-hydroxysteroid 3-dehydrogenase/mitotic-spindle organizing protein 1